MAMLAAFAADRRRSPEGLAIVGERSALHALAALVSDSTAVLARGEVARIVEERGVWAQVRLDDGRTGWVERARLVALDR
jgi:SH3-like domain-containing protein